MNENNEEKYIVKAETQIQKNDVIVSNVTQEYRAVISKISNRRSCTLVNMKLQTEIMNKLISSNTDVKLFSYFVTNIKKFNVVTKKSTNTPVDTKYLANQFNVTERKIRIFTSNAKEQGFIVKNKNKYIVNPFVVIPFVNGCSATVNDQIANQLQNWWTRDRLSDICSTIVTIQEKEILALSNKALFEDN